MQRITNKTILFIVCLLALSACGNDRQARIEEAVRAHTEQKKEAERNNAVQYQQLKKAEWILGSWKGVLGKGVSAERWYKQDDSTFAGAGAFIKGNVTLSQEHLQLTQTGDDIYYIATVKGQNNDAPIKFRMTTLTDRMMVVENAEHDFPQKITYTLYGGDSLMAEISGKVNGTVRSEQFPMKKDLR